MFCGCVSATDVSTGNNGISHSISKGHSNVSLTSSSLQKSKIITCSTSSKKIVSSALLTGTPSNPVIYGDKVVFEEWNGIDCNVMMWNIKTNIITSISSDPSINEGQPKIWENKIVHSSMTRYDPTTFGASLIRYYDIDSGSSKILDSNNLPNNPSIYGNTVVWQDLAYVNNDYFQPHELIKLGGPYTQTKNIAWGENPDVYGNYVVYNDTRNGVHGLYLYDISKGTERLITSSSGTIGVPHIYGLNVVWTDTRYGDCDIFMYNISNNVMKQITTETAKQCEPDIWENNIVWSDNRNGNYDIYGYNLLTGKTTRLTSSSKDEYEPSIYENILVYISDNNIHYQPVDIPPTVSASPKAGLYNTNKVINLSINKSGIIYYTKNGTTPTTSSTKYTSPITITTTTTLKFMAVDTAGIKSPIYTQTYTIDKIAPKVSSTTPTNLKTGVSRTSTITIKFKENIKSSTSYSSIKVKNLTTGKYVSLTKSISGNTLNLKTSTSKSKYTWYQVTIPSKAIKDCAGNNLIATYTFKFETGG